MGEINIHLDYPVRSTFERSFESSDVGPSKAVLFCAMEDLDAAVGCGRQAVCEFAGSVRRAVIDEARIFHPFDAAASS
jgi:hypothetical protein